MLDYWTKRIWKNGKDKDNRTKKRLDTRGYKNGSDLLSMRSSICLSCCCCCLFISFLLQRKLLLCAFSRHIETILVPFWHINTTSEFFYTNKQPYKGLMNIICSLPRSLFLAVSREASGGNVLRNMKTSHATRPNKLTNQTDQLLELFSQALNFPAP